MDPAVHKRYTGADNARILENLSRLLERGASLWIRIPVIPGVNDSPEEMEKIKAFLRSYPKPEKVELLPYHPMGEHKYAAIGKEAQIFSVPSDGKMMQLIKIFS
jgi:pyruvate formate lyase activating enzyme